MAKKEKYSKIKTDKRITLYVMEEMKEVAQDKRYELKVSGLGELIITMVKYYLYTDNSPTDYEYGLIDTLYKGPSTSKNKEVYHFRVDYNEVEIHILNLLSKKWDTTISKASNFILYKIAQLDYPQWLTLKQQVDSATLGFDSWVKFDLFVSDIDTLNNMYKILQIELDNDALYNHNKNNPQKPLPQSVIYNRGIIIQENLYDKIFKAGVDKLMEEYGI